MPIIAEQNLPAAERSLQSGTAPMENRAHLSLRWLWALTLTLTAIAGFASAMIGNCQAKFHPYYFDPVVYQYHCAELYWHILGSNNFAGALYEATHNAFYPLRTVPLALFCPSLLTQPLTPLATSLPALALLIFLLGYTVYQRSGSKPLAFASALLLTSLPAIYQTTYGIHAFWLDILAALLIGSAFLCLVNYKYSSKDGWLVGFALCVSLTAFARYIAIVYALVSLYPILLITLAQKRRAESWTAARCWLSAGLSIFLPGAICGGFLLAHASETYYYYHFLCYPLGCTVETSVSNLFPFLCEKLFTGPYALVLTAIWCINFFASWRERRTAFLDAAWFIFPFASFLFLNLCVLRPWENLYIMWYAVPLFIVAAVTPYAPLPRHVLKLLTAIALTLAVPSLLFSVAANYKSATEPDRLQSAIKLFDKEIARELVSTGPHTVWVAFFGEYSVVPIVEAFYQSGSLPRTPAELTFSVHEAYWKAKYPRETTAEICKTVSLLTNEKVQYAAVLADPNRALSAETNWFDNEITRQVAFHLAQEVTSSREWQFVRMLQHPQYGLIALYKNKHLGD